MRSSTTASRAGRYASALPSLERSIARTRWQLWARVREDLELLEQRLAQTELQPELRALIVGLIDRDFHEAGRGS